MSNLVIYLLGLLLVIVGLGYGAHLLGLSITWIAIGAIVILGLGVMGAVSKTHHRDHS